MSKTKMHKFSVPDELAQDFVDNIKLVQQGNSQGAAWIRANVVAEPETIEFLINGNIVLCEQCILKRPHSH